MEIVVFASWTSSRHYIAELNTSKDGSLTVLFTSPCGFSPTGMWPNSGNRSADVPPLCAVSVAVAVAVVVSAAVAVVVVVALTVAITVAAQMWLWL
jgi:hypothetical protein